MGKLRTCKFFEKSPRVMTKKMTTEPDAKNLAQHVRLLPDFVIYETIDGGENRKPISVHTLLINILKNK